MMTKTMKINVTVVTLVTGISLFAVAQTAPLHIGTTNGIRDQRGETLRGTSPDAPYFGFSYVQGEIVQILQANSGIFPPNSDGTPNTNNPVIATIRIGEGVDPTLGPSGMMGASLPQRPQGKIFARVFNGTSLESSSFYGDSQIYFVPNNGTTSTTYGVFIPQFTATDQALDTGDIDGDGVNNSWEEAYGSDSTGADEDGDGMSDSAEMRAGTDLNDADSLLQMVQLIPDTGDDLIISWDSVAGKSYQVERTDDLGSSSYSSVGDVVLADDVISQITVTDGLLTGLGHYRVRLVE